MTRLVAIDPGRHKCGLVLIDKPRALVEEGLVLSVHNVMDQMHAWSCSGGVDLILLGNGTSSDAWDGLLERVAPVQTVNERGTTLRARGRYWQLWPPKGLQRLIPQGMRIPPGDLDAVAALVMAEEHLGQAFRWPQPPPDFRSALAR